jgi:localization factor PodJL
MTTPLEGARTHVDALELRLAERIDELRAEFAERAGALEAQVEEECRRARISTFAFGGLLALAGAVGAFALGSVVRPMSAARPQSPAVIAGQAFADLPLRPTLPVTATNFPLLADAGSSPGAEGRPPGARADGRQSDDLGWLAQAISRGEPTALMRAQALAQAGAPRAQLLLAKLYEAGRGGLPHDLGLARQWTERAAQAGEQAAMHNLAVYMMHGEGGPAAPVEAARWFLKAAQGGVVDAQFNLAVLYEKGCGVHRNLGEAYRWYSIAANAGDGLARARAVALEARLTAKERALAGAAIHSFQPGQVVAPAAIYAPVVAPAATVAESQRLLAREGYFIGPADGGDSPAYRMAAATYLRDHPQAERLVLAP